MDGIGWLADNWVDLLQGVGIVGSLLFTAAALRQGARSIRLGSLLKLTEHHRELWSEVHRRPELARVLAHEVDLVRDPVTPAEEEFLNIVFVHFQTGWEMAVRHRLVSQEAYGRDLMEFLALPIPRDVWNRTRAHRDPPFTRFVEDHLAKGGPCSGSHRSVASRLFNP
ncbi:MAG: DUF6082 family protein [Limisphaerales bacterium]